MAVPQELTLTQAREAVREVRVTLSWDCSGFERALIGLEFALAVMPRRPQLALACAEGEQP
jgi:hypothetical protein